MKAVASLFLFFAFPFLLPAQPDTPFVAYRARGASIPTESLKTSLEASSFVPPYMLDENPAFVGGPVALKDYLYGRVRYTDLARTYGVEGRMFLRLFLDDQGNVTEVEVLRGLGFGMDEQVEEIFAAMPGWEPGTVSGKPVATSTILPLDFRLTP